MKLNLAVKAALGVAALSVAGLASANTSIGYSQTGAGATGNGDLFLNVVDTTTNTSFVYDTGLNQTTFSGSGSYSYTLTGDANYQAFTAAQQSGDSLEYSVFSTKLSNPTGVGSVYSTSTSAPTGTTGLVLAQTLATIKGFTQATDNVSSTTTNSAYVGSTYNSGTGVWSSNNAAANWGSSSIAGSIDSNLGLSDLGVVGTALAFYSTANSSANYGSASAQLSASTFAGTWDLVNGVLTYSTGSSSVPLPPSVLLMLSGLGMLAIIGRRKSTRDLTIHGMLA